MMVFILKGSLFVSVSP